MLIALEGIDGAGKATQASRLQGRARAAGLTAAFLSFPRYQQTLAAAAIEDYLAGAFGDIASVPPHFSAAMYALDRFESRGELERLMAGHDLVVVDRYVASNLAYQGARAPEPDREAFVRWVHELEHRVLGLPEPDLTVYLDVPVDLAARRIGRRRRGGAAALPRDIYERSLHYLDQCRRTYRFVAELGLYDPWVTLDVAGGEDGLEPDALTDRIWHAIQPHLPGSAR
ncbi:MAG TPA: dTMP kinase [Bacillota bacterium]